MTKHFIPIGSHSADDLMHVREFFKNHGTACTNASLILGGQRSQARTVGLIFTFREATRLSRHQKAELVHLHRLLTLDFVGHPDAEETAFFAEIDPGDPIVEEICLLSDRLLGVLKAIGRSHGDHAADAEECTGKSAA